MSDQDERLSNLKQLMRNTLQEDKELIRVGKPALKRLSNLKTCINELYALRTQVDSEVLFIIKQWLEPLPDKSLPNLSIKSELLHFLYKVNVTKDRLVNSEIGKIIYFYSINHKESDEIRKLSKRIVIKWTSIAINDLQ